MRRLKRDQPPGAVAATDFIAALGDQLEELARVREFVLTTRQCGDEPGLDASSASARAISSDNGTSSADAMRRRFV